MPRKKKLDAALDRLAGAPPLPAGVIDQLVTGPMTAGDLDAMFRQLKKAVLRVIDIVDTGHPALLRMWEKRQRGFRAMGYRIGSQDSSVVGD